MADLPITSDEGGASVILTDAVNTTYTLTIGSDGSTKTSLGVIDGKTNVLKTGTLVTTAVTADQVILTYTVTAGKTLFLEYFNMTCGLTVAPTNFNTPVIFGTISVESPSGTKDLTWRLMGPTPIYQSWDFAEPLFIAAGTVIRVVCTPGITTSLTWIANFGGYER